MLEKLFISLWCNKNTLLLPNIWLILCCLVPLDCLVSTVLIERSLTPIKSVPQTFKIVSCQIIQFVWVYCPKIFHLVYFFILTYLGELGSQVNKILGIFPFTQGKILALNPTVVNFLWWRKAVLRILHRWFSLNAVSPTFC